MNNGRPNQGNPGMWGQQPQQGQQPYQGQPYQQGMQQTQYRQQPYQQNQQQPAYYQGAQGQQPYRPQQAPYQQQPRQPYQQGFQQPVYQQPVYQQPQQGQQPYQQPYRPQQQPYQQGMQQTQYRQQPYAGQPYPGYPQQMPGGYQQPPQPQNQPRKPFNPAIILWVMLCGVLPVLFVLGLVLSDLAVLKWIFVGLSVATVAFLWLKPVSASNVRLTFSGVYGALAVVALVSALTSTAPVDSNNQNQNGGSSQFSSQVSQENDAQAGANLGDWSTEVPATATPTPTDGLQSAAVEQMKSFFYFWSVNNQDNMISLCAPSWRSSVSEPKVKLFSILANRTPVEYEAEKITGTENDTTRTVTVTAMINKNNGKDPEKYRFQVIMRKEDGQWYVDPASLESHETVTTTAPTANDTATPTAEFIATANTVLYYNANGGERYHLDAYCKSANEKYLPFTGQFYYSQLSEDAYKELVPCNICGAPLRP